MILSSRAENAFAMVSSTVYGSTLIMLYGASTYYHSCNETGKKQKLKIIDHACIYLLIAGSYTPFTLGPLKDFGGPDLLALEWTIAFCGILLKVIAVDRFKVISLLGYLAMGWLVVFSYEILMEEISGQSLNFLFAGGLCYTVGTVFYVWDKLPYNHGIWHLFVLGGSICHYFSILSLIG